MIHGWPDSYRLWDATVAALKDQYRCVRFTFPGFDRAHERRPRDIEEFSAFVRTVIEQVSPDRPVILLLHDWGCVYGYQFYIRHPEFVSKIVGADIGDPVSVRRELTVKTALMVLAYQVPLAFAWLIGGRIGDAIVRSVAKGIKCPADPATMHSGMTYPYYLMWFAGSRGLRRQFREFKPQVPMLYMYAKRKPFQFHTQGWLDWLGSRPGNQVQGFDTGHWIMSADPPGFSGLVRRWLG